MVILSNNLTTSRYSFVPSAKWKTSCAKSLAVAFLSASLSFEIYITSSLMKALVSCFSMATTFICLPASLPVSASIFSSFAKLLFCSVSSDSAMVVFCEATTFATSFLRVRASEPLIAPTAFSLEISATPSLSAVLRTLPSSASSSRTP